MTAPLDPLDPLDRLLEAVGRAEQRLEDIGERLLHGGINALDIVEIEQERDDLHNAAAEVRGARGKAAVAWDCEAHNWHSTDPHNEGCPACHCKTRLLYAAPPATVPREEYDRLLKATIVEMIPRAAVERLADAAHHDPLCAVNRLRPDEMIEAGEYHACTCGLDAAREEYGMTEGR